MNFDVDFSLNNRNFKADFGKVVKVGGDTETAYNQGYDNGYQEGYNVGEANGAAIGYRDGYDSGYQIGYNEGSGDGVQQGIEEGIEQGKTEILTESKYMNANVSGTVIAVNDVNDISHNVGVKLSSKNLFDGKISQKLILNGSGDNRTVGEATNYNCAIIKVKPNTTYCISGDFDSTSARPTQDKNVRVATFTNYPQIGEVSNQFKYGNTAFTITTSATSNYLFLWFMIPPTGYQVGEFQIKEETTATDYTPYISDFSNVEVSRYGKNLFSDIYDDYAILGNSYAYKYICDTLLKMSLKDKDISVDVSDCYIGFAINPASFSDGGRWVVSKGVKQYTTTNIPSTGKENFYSHILVYPPTKDVFNRIIKRWDIQVELGDVSTEYEPYKKTITYTSTADGTVEGVNSIAPNMTLLTNNNGVLINCNYLRDIDRYIDNLTTNIALTGGE